MDELNKIGSLAMDLKRVSLARWNGSKKVSDRFWQEVEKRKSEIEILKTPTYIANLIKNLNENQNFEDLLMYSVLLQNYTQAVKYNN